MRSEGPPPEEKGTATPAFETVVPVADKPDVVALAKESPADSAPVEVTGWGDVAVADAAPPDSPPESGEPVEDAPAAAPESEAPAVASADGGSLWMRVVAIAALVLTVVTVSGTVWAAHQRSAIADQDALRADYVQAAKQAMLNVTNISADTAQDDINRVLAVTSGDLHKDYTDRKDDYAGIVQKAQVRAKGEVVEAALQSSDDHSAIVLVAVKQVLTNAGADGQQQRQYRFKVTLSRDDKGGITATGMEMTV
ncbi:hypothetical protein NSERKGN1266_74380 [Nocardia seriolae]|nr:hypothetical protein NS14008_01250 [Nocardia seriolae]BAW10220.1 conserved hypothetical protein [Nocardia seriolae]BEK91487.1 hypothetical protein NSERKGN1266_74380 [Nocardia seriolae]GEM22450.1 hypothetical protein NS2_06890 [Nocardia seriolae NBRC 15557]